MSMSTLRWGRDRGVWWTLPVSRHRWISVEALVSAPTFPRRHWQASLSLGWWPVGALVLYWPLRLVWRSYGPRAGP